VRGRPWTHYAAPAAFLLAVTVAVLVVRSGLETAAVTQTQTTAPPPGTVATTTVTGRSVPAKQNPKPTPKPKTTTTTTQAPAAQYYTVVAGDTFGVISSRTGVTVAELERLNPNVESTALYIGQRIRIK
jgi:LysM repeat protein